MFFPLRDDNPTNSRPYVTWVLIGLNVVVFLLEVVAGARGSQTLFHTFGVVPAELTARPLAESYTIVSSMFLHGGLMHLLGNMWFLYLFGDNVEDRLGKPWFVVFYLASGAGASLLQVLIQPASPIPTIGASGAIAGVLGAYALMFPAARVVTFVWLFIFIRIIRVPALFFLGFWFLVQVINGVGALGLPISGGVAWWAHVGGFLVGLLVGYRMRPARPEGPPRALRTPGPRGGVIIQMDDRRRRTFH